MEKSDEAPGAGAGKKIEQCTGIHDSYSELCMERNGVSFAFYDNS